MCVSQVCSWLRPPLPCEAPLVTCHPGPELMAAQTHCSQDLAHLRDCTRALLLWQVINTCVGQGNAKLFLVYIATLLVAQLLFMQVRHRSTRAHAWLTKHPASRHAVLKCTETSLRCKRYKCSH